jgi:hypothetical protein
MRDHADRASGPSDPLDLVIDLSLDDGIAVIFDAVIIWATLLIPWGSRKVAEPVRQYAQTQLVGLTPDELAHWPVQRYWDLLVGLVHRHLQDRQISTPGPRRSVPPVACSAVERTRRAVSLAVLAQHSAIPEALELFANVVVGWAALYDLEELRAAVRRAGYTPDDSWTEQRYRAFIPYVIMEMLEH